MFIGPITGIFLLGVLTRRGNLTGVLVGAPAGLVLSYLLTSWEPLVQSLNWMWTAPLSCLATLVVGYLFSILIPGRSTVPTAAAAAVPVPPSVGTLPK
jgi:hypothetical protein